MSKLSKCKGPKCNAINGVGHSKECEEQHNSYFEERLPKNLDRPQQRRNRK